MFDGTADQAIQLYEKALGARVDGTVMRFGDAPSMGHTPPAGGEHRVMHAQLRIGEGVLMLSDGMPGSATPRETNTHVALAFEDVDALAKSFDALALGGQITMPLQDTFWGARFGMLTDAYGIHWMFNCELKKG
jgi:PhnB protein